MVTLQAVAQESEGIELKVVFAGSMGAGKTTAIRTISEIETISTDVPNNDLAAHSKETTTVGLDYGEASLGDNAVLRMYGTPGQERFRFMWDILGEGAFGVIVLVDNSQPDPLAGMDTYLDVFLRHVPAWRIVVGVGRTEMYPTPTIADFCDHIARRGVSLPVLSVDVRRAADVRLLLTVLVNNVEVDHG